MCPPSRWYARLAPLPAVPLKAAYRVEASQTLIVASLLPVQNRRLGSSTCAGSQEMLVMNLRWPCIVHQVPHQTDM